MNKESLIMLGVVTIGVTLGCLIANRVEDMLFAGKPATKASKPATVTV
jgi:hypothetical protein